jgi:hypothetical protein
MFYDNFTKVDKQEFEKFLIDNKTLEKHVSTISFPEIVSYYKKETHYINDAVAAYVFPVNIGSVSTPESFYIKK